MWYVQKCQLAYHRQWLSAATPTGTKAVQWRATARHMSLKCKPLLVQCRCCSLGALVWTTPSNRSRVPAPAAGALCRQQNVSAQAPALHAPPQHAAPVRLRVTQLRRPTPALPRPPQTPPLGRSLASAPATGLFTALHPQHALGYTHQDARDAAGAPRICQQSITRSTTVCMVPVTSAFAMRQPPPGARAAAGAPCGRRRAQPTWCRS